MEKEQQLNNLGNSEFKIIEGRKYMKVPSGYTVREYFSHFTEGKGPGPGWDAFNAAKDEIAKKYNIDISGNKLLKFKPSDLPDEPHYIWEEAQEDGE